MPDLHACVDDRDHYAAAGVADAPIIARHVPHRDDVDVFSSDAVQRWKTRTADFLSGVQQVPLTCEQRSLGSVIARGVIGSDRDAPLDCMAAHCSSFHCCSLININAVPSGVAL